MKLFTSIIEKGLIKNGIESFKAIRKDGNTKDYTPLVKIFTPDAQATWLFTELEIEDLIGDVHQLSGRLFGLCDLGMSFPELGYVDMIELTSLKGKLGLPVERDRHWQANKTLLEYADEARNAGRIIC